jgi:hypothetical protein
MRLYLYMCVYLYVYTHYGVMPTVDMESIDSLAKAINNFGGGLVLVSHDMRLISQVAKEIWLCDNLTVTKYTGEISDFKMRIRGQMQRENLIDGDAPGKAQKLLAPPAPTPGALKMAPPLPNPPKAESEEDLIRKARLELADLAIATQRARHAEEAKAKSAATEIPPTATGGNGSTLPTPPLSVPSDGDVIPTTDEADSAQRELDEKALLKLKRKAEKDAQKALEKKEEEERQRRREEKIRETEEAKRVALEEERKLQEFRLLKAAKDVRNAFTPLRKMTLPPPLCDLFCKIAAIRRRKRRKSKTNKPRRPQHWPLSGERKRRRRGGRSPKQGSVSERL